MTSTVAESHGCGLSGAYEHNSVRHGKRPSNAKAYTCGVILVNDSQDRLAARDVRPKQCV